jgi:hypothetical protein
MIKQDKRNKKQRKKLIKAGTLACAGYINLLGVKNQQPPLVERPSHADGVGEVINLMNSPERELSRNLSFTQINDQDS